MGPLSPPKQPMSPKYKQQELVASKSSPLLPPHCYSLGLIVNALENILQRSKRPWKNVHYKV
jgi:hypothetical protein